MSPLDDAGIVKELGSRLLTAFYVVLRSLKLYPLENTRVQQAIDDLHGQMTEFLKHEGGLELHLVGDFFFMNETRLRLDLSNFATFGSFSSALTGHGIGPACHRRQRKAVRVGTLHLCSPPGSHGSRALRGVRRAPFADARGAH